MAVSIINRLAWRAGAGDDVLAEDLVAHLRGEPLADRAVPVDLDLLSTELEVDLNMSSGGWVDLLTGDVYDDSATDPMTVGEDAVIDVEDDPDRWLWFDRTGSREGCRTWPTFTGRQRDPALRGRLERAIEGKGAFRRFRDLVHQENLDQRWYVFAGDRQLGRARELLAAEGIRVRPAAGRRPHQTCRLRWPEGVGVTTRAGSPSATTTMTPAHPSLAGRREAGGGQSFTGTGLGRLPG